MGRQESPEIYGGSSPDIFLSDGGEKTGSKELQPHRYLERRIPPEIINVLTQQRRTFEGEEIENLKENLALEGLINPLILALHDNRESCQRYLDGFNQLWKTDIKIKDLISVTEKGKEMFYILIAGECRLKALRRLQEEGRLGGRFFRNGKVKATIHVNITHLEAMRKQASENLHTPVPILEEANFYYRYFRLLRKEENPKLSKAQFAREVGRSEERIDRAIRFCELPRSLQELAEMPEKKERKILAFGILAEMGRLQRELGYTEEQLLREAVFVLSSDWTVFRYRKRVSNLIFQHKSSQGMMEIIREQQGLMEDQFARQERGRHINTGLLALIDYFSTIRELFSRGLIDKKASPLLRRSTVRLLRRLIELEREILPCLEGYCSGDEISEMVETIDREGEVLSQLEEELPETPEDYPHLPFPLGTTPSD